MTAEKLTRPMAARPATPLAEDAATPCAWHSADAPILFVGDIQGCAEDLARLLERARFDSARHMLIPLGDTVNRGPDAPGVLRLLREVGARPILGNHERALLGLAQRADVPAWASGPGSAREQLRGAGQWEQALEWMRTWPLLARGAGWIAVHAGLHPRLAPEATPARFLTPVRWCTAEGELPSEARRGAAQPAPGFAPWHAYYRGRDTVLYGHWARQGLWLRERLRGLDTGCVYRGILSGVWWPADRLVQTEAPRKAMKEGRL